MITNPTDGPVHTWFGLSYCNYQVLQRTLMQSMPTEWQERIVACLEELADAYSHLKLPEAYRVEAATEHIVDEMTAVDLDLAGITEDWHAGAVPPVDATPEEFAEWREEHEQPSPAYYDASGEELDPQSRTLLPVPDPVPHYNRGRTYIPPQAPTRDRVSANPEQRKGSL